MPDEPEAPPPPAPNQPLANSDWPILRLEAGDLGSYLLLRDSIHLFEWIALKYYAAGADVDERTDRANTVNDFVQNFRRAIIPDGCPSGWTEIPGGCLRNS